MLKEAQIHNFENHFLTEIPLNFAQLAGIDAP